MSEMTRRFGRTELQMPVFSVGGMRFQDGWQDKPMSEVEVSSQQALVGLLAHMRETGLIHLETARGYGVSERQIGAAFAAQSGLADDLILQTKIAPEKNPKTFLQNLEESFDRLGVKYIDLMSFHGINNSELLAYVLRPEGCLDAVKPLQKAGRIGHIGFSTHGELPVVLEAIHSGVFSYVNLHWYYIRQELEPAIAAAAEQDMGVFIISPNDKGGKLYEPSDIWQRACQQQHLHPMVFNALWCLQDSRVHTLSHGAAHAGHLQHPLDTIPLLPQAEALTRPIDMRLRQHMVVQTGFDSPEKVALCLSTSSDAHAPAGLNLRTMYWLAQLLKGWRMESYCKMRMNLLGNGGHWFLGAKAEDIEQVSESALVEACENVAVVGVSPVDVARELREVCLRLKSEQVKRNSQS